VIDKFSIDEAERFLGLSFTVLEAAVGVEGDTAECGSLDEWVLCETALEDVEEVAVRGGDEGKEVNCSFCLEDC
jgi:hypothetical protein